MTGEAMITIAERHPGPWWTEVNEQAAQLSKEAGTDFKHMACLRAGGHVIDYLQEVTITVSDRSDKVTLSYLERANEHRSRPEQPPYTAVEVAAGFNQPDDAGRTYWLGRQMYARAGQAVPSGSLVPLWPRSEVPGLYLRVLEHVADEPDLLPVEFRLVEADVPSLRSEGRTDRDLEGLGANLDVMGRALGVELPRPGLELAAA